MGLRLQNQPSKSDDPVKPTDPPKQDPPADPPKEGVFDQKLDGDDVPDALKGKTVKEALGLLGQAQATISTLQRENKQWSTLYDRLKDKPEPPNQPASDQIDPVAVLGEEGAQAAAAMMQRAVGPIYEGLSGIFKTMAKDMFPDFEENEEAIEKIFNQMTPPQKVHPAQSWFAAYKLHKAGQIEPPARKPPNHDPAGPPTPTPKKQTPEELATDQQKEWASKQGLSLEEYLAYGNVYAEDEKLPGEE